MEIVIRIDKSVPEFARAWVGHDVSTLVEQIRVAVHRGRILPGDALPSVRQLAIDLELDREIVAKAYYLLEQDSVIQKRGYRGAFVHEGAGRE